MSIKSCLHLFSIVLLAILSSCSIDVAKKPSSSGKTCEVVVVANTSDFQNGLGDSIKAFLMRNNPHLNQMEPMFDVLPLSHEQFNKGDMFKHLRNIIVVNYTPTDTSNFIIRKDLWASNQMIFEFNVANLADFSKVFDEKKVFIENVFLNSERERMKRIFKTTENIDISDLLYRRFGFKIICPEGFVISTNNDTVVAVFKDTKNYTQTILIYRYRYINQSFTQKNILQHRDFLGENFVKSDIDSAFMGTELRVPPISDTINFHSAFAVRTRGLWRFYGDFMGGPFQNYTFYDKASGDIIMIDAFLYAPKKEKRDLMMQLEGIVYSLEWAKN